MVFGPIAAGIGGAISGAASGLLGPIIGGGLAGYGTYRATRAYNEAQLAQAREVMAHEAEQAQILRKWQEGMSNTAISRSMRDMKRAGLNPIMAISKPAATPGGAMGRGHMAQLQNPGAAGISSAFDASRSFSETAKVRDIIQNIRQDTMLKFAQGGLVNAQKWRTKMEADLRELDQEHRKLAIDIIEQDLKTAKREGELSESEFGWWTRRLREVRQSLFWKFGN